MLRLSICIGLLVFSGTILAQDSVQQQQQSPQMSGKFLGFFNFDRMRRSFCQRFCVNSDTKPYVANLFCAAKCPELYLPHQSTTITSSPTGTVTSTTSIPTTLSTTPSATPSTTLSTTPSTTLSTTPSTAST